MIKLSQSRDSSHVLTAEAAEQFENTKAIIVRRRVSFFGNVSFFAFEKKDK